MTAETARRTLLRARRNGERATEIDGEAATTYRFAAAAAGC